MNCDYLEVMSMDQLRGESRRYQLPVYGSRENLIDNIMTHFERNGPMLDMIGSVPTDNEDSNAQPTVRNTQPGGHSGMPVTADTFKRMMATVNMCVQQQQSIMQQLALLSNQVSSGNSTSVSSRVENSPSNLVLSANHTADPNNQMSNNSIRQTMIHSLPPANAVQLLSPQIPEFGGTDEENVRLWTQRVDRIAQIHRAPDDVILLAASSKLTKGAKQWNNIQQGAVLEFWISLRQDIIKMFDKRVPYCGYAENRS